MPTQVTWLGHSAFRLDTEAGTRVYVDPFLSGNPTCPAGELEPERCDLIAITHGHSDHVGDTLAIAERFGCPVVAHIEVRQWLTRHGLSDDGMAHSPNKGGTVTVGDVSITLTSANHSSSAPDGTYLGEPCGLVIAPEGGPVVYFAGDTNVFGDMALIARVYRPRVAVLPIGGHFTMDPHEAAVALELLGVARCIPCHYGTFGLIPGTPSELRRLAPAGVKVLEPAPGETLDL